jgi:hypothetical protein
MPRPAIPTDRTDCVCGARVIKAGRLVLDWEPSPYGTIAAYQGSSGAWLARQLRQGEIPLSYEKRRTEHDCTTT